MPWKEGDIKDAILVEGEVRLQPGAKINVRQWVDKRWYWSLWGANERLVCCCRRAGYARKSDAVRGAERAILAMRKAVRIEAPGLVIDVPRGTVSSKMYRYATKE